MSDIAQQVEDVRKALQNLSNDALCLRRAMGKRREPPDEWEEWGHALRSILGNVNIAINEGKQVQGDANLLPWIKKRIEGLNLPEETA